MPTFDEELAKLSKKTGTSDNGSDTKAKVADKLGTATPFADLSIEDQIADNNTRLTRFQHQGMPIDVTQLRIITMLEAMVKDMSVVEPKIQQRIHEVLVEAESHLAQAKLTGGIQGPGPIKAG